jgi:hypothetical protein
LLKGGGGRGGGKKMPERRMVFLGRAAPRDRWHLQTDFSRVVGRWRRGKEWKRRDGEKKMTKRKMQWSSWRGLLRGIGGTYEPTF